MKTGLAQGIWALKLARESGAPLPTVTFLFNGDEEIGSLSSRPVIEEAAQKADVTLVLEPTAHGAVKTARKGTGIFQVTATGVEAHAGSRRRTGRARSPRCRSSWSPRRRSPRPSRAPRSTPGSSGWFGHQRRRRAGHRRRRHPRRQPGRTGPCRRRTGRHRGQRPGVRIEIDHGWNRPPMTLNAASAPLLDLAREVAREQGRESCPTPPSAAPATPTSSPRSACRCCAAWARSGRRPRPGRVRLPRHAWPPRRPWSRACSARLAG